MITLQLKSANEVYDMVKNNEVPQNIALEYARNKHDDLKDRNKNRRAMLWARLIEKLEPKDIELEKPANNNTDIPAHLRPDFKRVTPEEKLARGMVMKKVDGCKMYVWPTQFWSLGKNGYTLSKAKQALGAALYAN